MAQSKIMSDQIYKNKVYSQDNQLLAKQEENNLLAENSQDFRSFVTEFLANSPPLNAEQEIAAYRQMLLIRRFEEKAGQLYGMGLIGGFCHLYIGQEAVVVGSLAAKEQGDQVITSYRDHGHILALGADPRYVMAELTGRANGVCKGKGGSMHMFAIERDFYGGHGIVAAQVSLGTGLAFANKYRGNSHMSFIYFGDGAANQGQVYESFNMASLWNLPALYMVENNRYAMGTSVQRAAAEVNFVRHGLACGIPGIVVNGMDVVEVRQKTQAVAAWIRANNGPVLMDIKTYRYRGHSMSDPGQYRSKGEVQEIRENFDPIEQSKKLLQEADWISEAQLKEIESEIRHSVNEAAKFAQEDAECQAAEIDTDILI